MSRCYGDCNQPVGYCASAAELSGWNQSEPFCICEDGIVSSGVLINGQTSCVISLRFERALFGIQLIISLILIAVTLFYVAIGGKRVVSFKSDSAQWTRLKRRMLRLAAQGMLIGVSILKLSGGSGRPQFGVDLGISLLFGNAGMLFILDTYSVLLKYFNYVQKKRQSLKISDDAAANWNKRFPFFIGFVLITSNIALFLIPVVGGRIGLGLYFIFGAVLLFFLGIVATWHFTVAIGDYDCVLRDADPGAISLIRSVKNARRQAAQMRTSYCVMNVIGTFFISSFAFVPRLIFHPELLGVYTSISALSQIIDVLIITCCSRRRRDYEADSRSRTSSCVVPKNISTGPSSTALQNK